MSTLRSATAIVAPASGLFFGATAMVSMPPLLRSSLIGNGKARLPGLEKQLTQIYSALGEPKKALEYAQKAIDAAPDDPTAMANYAGALLENERIDEALKYAQRASAIMPDDPMTQRLLALLEARFGKRGFGANLRSVLKDAGSWFKLLRRRKRS